MSAHCAHCGFEHVDAAAKFCSRCGAIAHVSHASTWSIVTDWSEHYVGSHGALWRTLRQLFFSPGALTQTYFQGGRGGTLKPIQLYLLASLLSFFSLGFFAGASEESGKVSAANPSGGSPIVDASTKGSKLHFSFGSDQPEVNLSWESLEAWFARQSFVGAQAAKKRLADLRVMPLEQRSREILKSAKRFAPVAGILLVPLLALFTKLFWNFRMRYAEHVVFALHLQTVVLLFAIPFFALNMLDLPDWLEWVVILGLIAWVWLAARRVFRCSALGVSLRLVPSLIFYIVTVIVALVAVFLLALLIG